MTGPEITPEMIIAGGPGLEVPLVLDLIECAFIVRALKLYQERSLCLNDDGFKFSRWDDPAAAGVPIRAARKIETQVLAAIDKEN